MATSTSNIMKSLALAANNTLQQINDSVADKAKAAEKKAADIRQQAQQIISNPSKFSVGQILNIALDFSTFPEPSKLIKQIQEIVAKFIPSHIDNLKVLKAREESNEALLRSDPEEATRRRLAEQTRIEAELKAKEERKKAEEALREQARQMELANQELQSAVKNLDQKQIIITQAEKSLETILSQQDKNSVQLLTDKIEQMEKQLSSPDLMQDKKAEMETDLKKLKEERDQLTRPADRERKKLEEAKAAMKEAESRLETAQNKADSLGISSEMKRPSMSPK